MQAPLDRVIADFNEYEELDYTISIIGERYYSNARRKGIEGLSAEAAGYFQKAIDIWQRTIAKLPASPEYTPSVYFRLGVIYSQELGQFQKGIDNFKAAVGNWPDFEYAGCDLLLMARYYQSLKQAGDLAKTD